MVEDPGDATISGGHTRQLNETARFLRQRGHAVDVAREVPTADAHDVIHLFTTRESVATAALRTGNPVVVSTIYFNRRSAVLSTSSRVAQVRTEARRRAVTTLRSLRGSPADLTRLGDWTRREREMGVVLRMCDVLLPNSEAEAADLRDECGVPADRIMVVPNGVDAETPTTSPDDFTSAYGERDFVLSVGRVEPIKNPLRLIRACRKVGRRLVLIDQGHPDHRALRSACEKELGDRGVILPAMPSDHMLRSAYAAASVHALPSHFETTGLVSLEAAMQRTPIVVGEGAHTREYFGGFASFCEPRSVTSIGRAIEDAARQQDVDALRERILSLYTWQRAAEVTESAYRRAIALRADQGDRAT